MRCILQIRSNELPNRTKSSLGRYAVANYVKLGTMTYVDMLSMIERQQQGGLCFVGSKRHAKTNSKYLQYYNPEQEPNYLM